MESDEAIALRGHRWLQSLLASAGSMRVTPALGGKWQRAYSWLGGRPNSELDAVARFVVPHLRRGTLKERCVTPQHLVDYWARYLESSLPFALPARRAEPQVDLETQRAEFVRAAAAQRPSWLTARTDDEPAE